MNINGVMKNERNLKRHFVLPDKSKVARSLRFGAHSVILKETMQILPVGTSRRTAYVNKTENTGQEQTKQFVKKMLSSLNVRSLLM
jgi:hypothetical protein